MTLREIFKALCCGNHIAFDLEELVDKIDND